MWTVLYRYMFRQLRTFLFPEVDAEVSRQIDTEIVRNMHRLSFIMFIYELLAAGIASFMYPLNSYGLVSLASMLFCALACLIIFLISRRIMHNGRYDHDTISFFKVACFMTLTIWAVWVSYRQYCRGEQILTFFAAELAMVCFVPMAPFYTILLNGIIYVALYTVIYLYDGAMGFNLLNYVILGLITIVCMIMRHHSQVRIAEKTIQLEKNNELLAHLNRHDVLTGLRNRLALDEDVRDITGHLVTVYMIDVNCFKEINDRYGHLVGDEVLKAAALHIRTLFPGGLCYRYGGDEFLVLNQHGQTYRQDTYLFSTPGVQERQILLSIGSVSGTPENHDQIFQMIASADASLYAVKRMTHSPDYQASER